MSGGEPAYTAAMRPSLGAPIPRTGWRTAISSLENSQFRWLFASNVTFFFAMQGQMIVRSIIAFDLTQSALALGLINFAVAIPMMLVSPFGGVVADRVERRQLILGGQGLLICSEITILTLLVTGRLEFWHLVTAATLMGCIFPFIMPARSAIVVNIIGKRGLQNAMALQMGGMNATRILGPTAAGFLVPLIGLSGAFAVGTTLYGCALLCMLGVDRSPPPEQARDASVVANLSEGVRYMAQNRLVLVLMLFGIVPMFLAMPFQTLLVVFTEEVWRVGSQGLGVLYASAGIGGLLGSAYLAQRSEALGRLRLMVASVLLFASFLFLFALSPWFLLALPLVLVANVFASIFNTLNQTAVQLLIPDHVRGRISSFMMMSFGITPLGTLPMSAVAEHFGAPVAVSLAAVSVTAVAVLFVAGSPALRSVDVRTREALEHERREERRAARAARDAQGAPGAELEPASVAESG